MKKLLVVLVSMFALSAFANEATTPAPEASPAPAAVKGKKAKAHAHKKGEEKHEEHAEDGAAH